MGARANLVLVESSDPTKYRLFYCHWCAQSLDTDLFWGPDHALAFILDQKSVTNGIWMNRNLAEGGVVMDTFRKVVLFYTGSDILKFDIPMRRLHLDLMRIMWEGWEVRYADDALQELVNYVEYPRERIVFRPAQPMPTTINWRSPVWMKENEDSCYAIVSIRGADLSFRLFPSYDENAADLLNIGPRVLDSIPYAEGLAMVNMREWIKGDYFPWMGVHFDLTSKTIAFWHASDEHFLDLVEQSWSGWTIHNWKDRFEEQIEVAGGRLAMPTRSEDAMISDLEKELLRPEPRDSTAGLRIFIEHEINMGKKVEVNPDVWQVNPQDLLLETRHALFGKALATYRSRR